MDSVEMESVQIKEEFSEPELVPFRAEVSGLASLPIKQELCEMQIKEELSEPELVPFRAEVSGLASLPIKQELCEMQCDSSQPQVSEVKAEHSELEISQTEEPLPVKQEEVLEINHIKQEPPEVEFDHMEPGKEESEDFKPNIPELERICVREQGTGEEGSPNSMQGGGKEDGQSPSECSLAGE
ncbi:UNVERIFIED_CONTAM: hypothetical protein FKN15_053834 [Acipenser sinensis]